MPDVSGPFDSGNYMQAQWYRDRGYQEASGVQGAALATPNPTLGDLALTMVGRTSSLALGRARVRAAYYERTGTAWTYAHPANTDPVNYRLDRIVLRRDPVAKTVAPAVLQGVPAGAPVAPALTQVEDGVWELPLYRVQVPPASGTVMNAWDERYWLPGRGGIPAGENVPGEVAGTYRDHPTYGPQRWDGTQWVSVAHGLIRGKMWRTVGGTAAFAVGVDTLIGMNASRVSGGFGFASDALILPLPGRYDLDVMTYLTNPGAGAVGAWIRRIRAGSPNNVTGQHMLWKPYGTIDVQQAIRHTDLPYLAGDQLALTHYAYHTNIAAYGVQEAVGIAVTATYVGPLNGSSPL